MCREQCRCNDTAIQQIVKGDNTSSCANRDKVAVLRLSPEEASILARGHKGVAPLEELR